MLLKSIVEATMFLLFINGTTAKKNKTTPWPPVVKTSRKAFHRSVYEESGNLGYYSFSNIRYGRITNRFTAPAQLCTSIFRSCHRGNPSISRPTTSDDSVNDNPKCSQAIPHWKIENINKHEKKRENTSINSLIHIPLNEVEDCLFLDIMVPRKTWDQTHIHAKVKLAPVLVWIHGGGFTSGDKSLHKDPSPLLARGIELHKGGMIVVSINYRLGLFGFLSGDYGVISNAGLLDQRMALGWVQSYINKFGGDRSRVTVIGEGAGAGSIMHHLTAPNISSHFFPNLQPSSRRHREFPFRSAILQSPTFLPLIPSQSENTRAKVLAMASKISGRQIKSIKKLRKLPYDVLYAVNIAIVNNSSYGTFTFGPAVDHVKGAKSYVPDFPLRRLRAGIMAKDVAILLGRRKNEGNLSKTKHIASDSGFKAHLARTFPTVAKHHIDYMSEKIYPKSDYDSFDHGEVNRSADALADLFVNCNVKYLLKYFRTSYGYFLDMASISQDQLLKRALFSDGGPYLDGFNTSFIFQNLQKKLIRFSTFIWSGTDTVDLKRYHEKSEVLLVTDEGLGGYIQDPNVKNRCHYWAEASYGGTSRGWS
ncbi:Carboxylesterase patB [Golovinomyces cichoracearum]|uniref:Carboxylesterase patB n=1 Tax=Golovinomyces cichoracearum TaxID=62708 RepID=A0A420JBD5_9PEZI|nr:Carboxylesterase patB [Golovinomyces cichoracearum]